MKKFQVEKECGKGTYQITVKIIIYRNLLGRYPHFLADFETESPYDRKKMFTFFVEGDLDYDTAAAKRADLEQSFSKIIQHCEHTGEWEKSPFYFGQMKLLNAK